MKAYLDLRIRLFRVESNVNREKIVGVPTTTELHTSGLVGHVYHRKLPQEGATLLISVSTVILSYYGRIYAMSAKK